MPNHMTYIRQKHPRSFLMLYTDGDSYRLRDYSAPAGPEIIVGGNHKDRDIAADILRLAKKRGNRIEGAPAHRADDYPFRHDRTIELDKLWAPLPPRSWLDSIVEFVKPHVGKAVGAMFAAAIAAILGWFGFHRWQIGQSAARCARLATPELSRETDCGFKGDFNVARDLYDGHAR